MEHLFLRFCPFPPPPSHNDPLTPLVNANYINYPERNPQSDPISCSTTLAFFPSFPFQVEHRERRKEGTSSAGDLEHWFCLLLVLGGEVILFVKIMFPFALCHIWEGSHYILRSDLSMSAVQTASPIIPFRNAITAILRTHLRGEGGRY